MDKKKLYANTVRPEFVRGHEYLRIPERTRRGRLLVDEKYKEWRMWLLLRKGATPAEIAAVTGMCRSSVDDYLKRLAQQTALAWKVYRACEGENAGHCDLQLHEIHLAEVFKLEEEPKNGVHKARTVRSSK